jgi:hypothetical protein
MNNFFLVFEEVFCYPVEILMYILRKSLRKLTLDAGVKELG